MSLFHLNYRSCFKCAREEFFFSLLELTIVEANCQSHVHSVSVGSPFENRRRVVSWYLLNSRLIVAVHGL